MGSRLPTFARKPAPIQVTAWGHALGTGLSTMDYFFADPVSVPPEDHRDFVEEVAYLPALFCYQPPSEAILPGPLPSLEREEFTFGYFNRFQKISDELIALWARIFGRLPHARLLLKAAGLERPDVSELVRNRLVHAGMNEHRLEFIGWTPREQQLALHRRVDLNLDPFPHAGGTSTAESFWMGVPVVTRIGRGILERQGASFSLAVGLDEFVARNADEYVDCAVNWTHRRPELARIRGELRQRLLSSPLGDAPSYVRAVEAWYREMWLRWLSETDATGEKVKGT